MSGPVRVRLVPREHVPGHLMLGPIALCSKASAWIRSAYPDGATFREAWEACPDADWLAYVAKELAERAEAPGPRQDALRLLWCSVREGDPADPVHASISYDEIEAWIRKVMSGRPEVIS